MDKRKHSLDDCVYKRVCNRQKKDDDDDNDDGMTIPSFFLSRKGHTKRYNGSNIFMLACIVIPVSEPYMYIHFITLLQFCPL